MGRLLLYTAVALWSTCVLDPISPTLEKSRRSWSQRLARLYAVFPLCPWIIAFSEFRVLFPR